LTRPHSSQFRAIHNVGAFRARFRRGWSSLILLLILVGRLNDAALADTTPPASATTNADPTAAALKPCTEGPDAAARAVACTAVIGGGGLTGKALAAAYLFRGNAQVERQQFEAAIDDFSKALSIDTQATDALYNRAAAYAAMGRLDLAIADYGHLLKIAPNDADTLFNRAWLYSMQGKYDAATDDLTKVLIAKPDDFETRLRRAGIAIQLGRNEDAIADCSRLLKIAPQSPVAFYNRGRAEYAKGDYDAAAGDFGAAVKNLEGIGNASLRAYATLRLALASAHAGKDTPPQVAALAKEVPQDQWPMPIVAFYLGSLGEDDLLQATHVADAARAANLGAEAEYYIGQWALLKQDKKTAKRHFKAAIAGKADRANLEFIDAGIALRKLGS
jgi:tetratricopeptide (TPR) repeat protein